MSGAAKEIIFNSGKNKSSIKINFDESVFFEDSKIYNHNLARVCSVFCASGYDMPVKQNNAVKTGISASLSEIEMKDIELYPLSLENEVSYFLANKEISNNKEKRTLIFAAFLGSHYGQWYTNFDAGTEEVHKGFGKAASFALDRLNAYIEKYSINKEDCVLLLTGHSRGAATANLLAAKIINDGHIKPESIFTYTFASPTLTRSEEVDSEKYGSIFNFINSEDFVTRCMPPQWGYKRYGKTLVLPCKNNFVDYKMYLKKVNSYYSILVPDNEYYPFRNSTDTMDSLFNKLIKYVPDINAYYNKAFNLNGREITLYEYFNQSLCSIIGEPAGSKKIEQGTKMLVKTSILRPCSSRALRLISDFFIFYEGLAGVTKDKISKHYFTYGHDVCTYCALVEAVSNSQIKAINKVLR